MRKQLAARYQTVETRKDGVKFTSKALAAAAERLQAVSREYDRCQHTLVEQARGPAPEPSDRARPLPSCSSSPAARSSLVVPLALGSLPASTM